MQLGTLFYCRPSRCFPISCSHKCVRLAERLDMQIDFPPYKNAESGVYAGMTRPNGMPTAEIPVPHRVERQSRYQFLWHHCHMTTMSGHGTPRWECVYLLLPLTLDRTSSKFKHSSQVVGIRISTNEKHLLQLLAYCGWSGERKLQSYLCPVQGPAFMSEFKCLTTFLRIRFHVGYS